MSSHAVGFLLPPSRAADRVRIEIVLSPCCTNDELRQEWFPRLSAGQSVEFNVAVPVPEGRAMVMVTVSPWQGYKKMRESDRDHFTLTLVGYPPR